ncbi:solute carrier family 22 member 3-like [Ornithodoros turicata]|uniref:solute carrier family 22 member 3-like n=1 Tax=Ornithodoros turicata TaxID=34597 RepID=UPI00313957AD
MAFEDVLVDVGGYGLFQKTLLTAIVILGTWHMTLGYYGHLFSLLTPATQWCFVNGSSVDSFNKSSLHRGACQFISHATSVGGNASVFVDRESTCPSGWMYDENDILLTTTMEKNWLCGNSDKLYTVHTVHWIGSITGFLVSGFLADRFGRRKTISGLIIMTIVANLGGLIFTNHVPFAVFRFFSGAGTYTTCTSCFILVMEYTISSRRTLVAFLWGTSWTVMATLYPWYASWIGTWRGLFISTAMADALLLLTFWWAPESSSWLISRGQKKEAVKLLQWIAKFNGKDISEEQIEKTFEQRDDSEFHVESEVAEELRGFWSSTLALVETPRIRKNTLLVLPIWCLITMSIYVGSLQLGRMGLHVYSVYSITSAFELPVNIFCVVALDRLGRRWPNVAFIFIGGLICVIMAIVQTDSQLWTIVMATLYMACFSGGFNITYQVASELFPTGIRGRAVLLQRMMSELGSVLGTQVAATVEWNQYLPLLVSGILAMLASVLVMFLPETVGLPLPQTIADGENLGKDRPFCFCPCIRLRKDTNSDKDRHCSQTSRERTMTLERRM